MQYTSKKTFPSVLIIKPSGLRYRLQEDHHFKEIRYAQATKVKVKKDPYVISFWIYLPFLFFSQLGQYHDRGFDLFQVTNLILIACIVSYLILGQQIFTVAIEKNR